MPLTIKWSKKEIRSLVDERRKRNPYKKYVYRNDTLCVRYVYVFVNSVL